MPALVPPSTDERTLLLGFLDQQRYAVKLAAYGLSDAQARDARTPSRLTVGGLIKHLTRMERGWLADVRGDAPAKSEADYLDAFEMQPGESVEGLIADYDAVARDTARTIEAIDDLNHPVPVPRDVPWFPKDVAAWSVRWVLLHLIEETARHAGHADLLREAVDGATAYPLLAAAENWPATPWLQPWQPADATSSEE
jgi:hypothetical protein